MDRKGQSTVEYFVLVSIIAAALIGMQVYLKRTIQGRARYSADQLSGGIFYAPGSTRANSEAITNIEESGTAKGKIRQDESTITRETNLDEETLPLAD